VADDHVPADGVAREWPFEGHFVVGGSGLYMGTGCLGGVFTSRTASYDLTIGLPQVDATRDPIGPEIRRRAGMGPAVPRRDLMPPAWAYGPINEKERGEEQNISPVWGAVLDDGTAKKVYPESARDTAVVYRCRFYTTLTASDGEEFEAAAQEFLSELGDWWTRFTSWVGILTSQDFVGLGGHPGGMTRSYPLFTWTSDANGERASTHWRRYFSPNRGIPMSKLELTDLQACVTATGNQDPPPAEWGLIRDARSLLRAGQNRRAMIDAGTAAEVGMTTLIDRYLAAANVDEPVRKALTKRYGALEGRAALLRKLRPGVLSDQLQRDLIEPRNHATHGGREFTDAEAQTAVDMANSIVEEAHPLAGLLPTQEP
jgi:hypothetical protein